LCADNAAIKSNKAALKSSCTVFLFLNSDKTKAQAALNPLAANLVNSEKFVEIELQRR
jgi:hypothetical protein